METAKNYQNFDQIQIGVPIFQPAGAKCCQIFNRPKSDPNILENTVSYTGKYCHTQERGNKHNTGCTHFIFWPCFMREIYYKYVTAVHTLISTNPPPPPQRKGFLIILQQI